MIYNDHAVIEYQPIAPLTERLTWSSAVGVSFAGYESRQSRRCSPRCRITAQYHVESGDIRTEIFSLVNDKKWGTDGIWYCPLWHLGINVDSLTTGSNTVDVTDFLERGFNADGGHLILSPAAEYIEAVAVPYTATFDATAGTDGSITFTLAAAMGVTTMIAPLYEANLIGERGFEGEGGDSTLNISYDLVTSPTVHYGSGGVYPFTDVEMLSYPTLGVSDDDSNEGERVQEYATGGRAVIVERELPATNSRFSGVLWWSGLTDEGVEADLVEFRRFLYRREGRTISFLRPSFYHDFTVTAVTADYIEVDGNLSDVVANYITETCPFVSLFDYIYVEKVFSVNTAKTAAGSNRIYVNEDPTAFTDRNLCLMSVDRLAGDETEIEWIENRTCRVSLQMVSTPVGAVRGLAVQADSGCGVDVDGDPITSGVLPDKEIPGIDFDGTLNDDLAVSPDGSVFFVIGDGLVSLVHIGTKTITSPLQQPRNDDDPLHAVFVDARACFALGGYFWVLATNSDFWNTYEYDGTWRDIGGVVEIPGTSDIATAWANPTTNRVYMVDSLSSSVIVFKYDPTPTVTFTRLLSETIRFLPSPLLDITGTERSIVTLHPSGPEEHRVIFISDGSVARAYATTDANQALTIRYARDPTFDITFDRTIPGGVGTPSGMELVGSILYAGDGSSLDRITATCVVDILGVANTAPPPPPISTTVTVPVPNGHFYLGDRQCVLDPSAAVPTPSTTDLGCGLDASGNTIRPWDEIAKYPIGFELNGIAVNQAADGLVLLRDDGYLVPFDTTTNTAGTAKPPQTGAENATGLFRIGNRYYATTNTTWYAYTDSLNPSQTDNIPAPGGIQLRSAWFDPATNRLYGSDITNIRTRSAHYDPDGLQILVWKHSSSTGFTRAVDEDMGVAYGGKHDYIAAITGRDDLMVIGVIRQTRIDPIILKRVTYTDDDIVRYAEAFQYFTFENAHGTTVNQIQSGTWFAGAGFNTVFFGDKPGPWAMIGNSLYTGFRRESVYDPNTRQYAIVAAHLKEVCDAQLCDESLAFHSLQPAADIPPRMYFGMVGDGDNGIIYGGCHPLYGRQMYNDAYFYTRSGHGITVNALTVTGDGASIPVRGHQMTGSTTDGMIYGGVSGFRLDKSPQLLTHFNTLQLFRRYTRSGTTLNLTQMLIDYGANPDATLEIVIPTLVVGKYILVTPVMVGDSSSGLIFNGSGFVRYDRTGATVTLQHLSNSGGNITPPPENYLLMVGDVTSGIIISTRGYKAHRNAPYLKGPAFHRYVVSGSGVTLTTLDVTHNEDTKYYGGIQYQHSSQNEYHVETGYLQSRAARIVGDDNSGMIISVTPYDEGKLTDQRSFRAYRDSYHRITRYTRTGDTITLEDFCPTSLYTHAGGGITGDANNGIVYGGHVRSNTLPLSGYPFHNPGTASFGVAYDNHFYYYEYS